MAKKISKKINSKFNPTFVSGYPIYAYGGRMNPKEYGFGSWLGENAGAIGTVAGTIGGAFLGAPQIGAQIGGSVGGAVQKGVEANQQEEELQQQLIQQQQDALKEERINNIPAQHDYVPTFATGGKISEVTKGTKEEMEHTSSKKKSRKIAKEHLQEDPKYYTKLKKAGLADSYNLGGLMNSYADGGPLNPNYKDIYKGINNYKQSMKDWENTQAKMDSTLNAQVQQGGLGNYSVYSQDNIPVNPIDTMSNQTLKGYNDWMQNKIDSIKNSQSPQYKEAPIYNNYANGGNLDNITDRLSEVDSGQTHEQSPIGGVPVTKSALVEDDEFIFTTKKGDKYVFSNRLTVD